MLKVCKFNCLLNDFLFKNISMHCDWQLSTTKPDHKEEPMPGKVKTENLSEGK